MSDLIAARRLAGRALSPVSPLGFGSFKIGRNAGIKYPSGFDLPTQAEVDRLLNGILDLGCNLIDTAPAYGLSEERIGCAISHRRSDFILSTKVGETFEDGKSVFDFSESSIRSSLERSLRRLSTDVLDLVLIHSNGDDQRILTETPIVAILQDYKSKGVVRAIGLSGKTVEGAELALPWADALMVEYNLRDDSHRDIMLRAAQNGLAVFVKKGLGSGHLSPADSIRFVLSHPGVTSLIVGGMSLDHFRDNWGVAVDLATGQG